MNKIGNLNEIHPDMYVLVLSTSSGIGIWVTKDRADLDKETASGAKQGYSIAVFDKGQCVFPKFVLELGSDKPKQNNSPPQKKNSNDEVVIYEDKA